MSASPIHVESESDPAARAEALRAIGRHAEAIPWLERAIAADPTDVEPYCQLALACLDLGDNRRAVREAERAIRVGPNHEWPHRVQAIALVRIGSNSVAVEAGREAVRLAPSLPEAHIVCATALLANHENEAARASAERAVRLGPDRASAHEMLGDVLLALNQFEPAEDAYRRALTLDPQSFEALNNLGVTLQNLRRPREAMEMFLQAARVDPTNPTARENLAESIDDWVDPRPATTEGTRNALWGGILALGVIFPPIRALLLLYWLGVQGVKQWRRLTLPASMKAAYRLQRPQSTRSMVLYVCLGVMGAMLLGSAAIGAGPKESAAFVAAMYAGAAGCLALTVLHGRRLWERVGARQTGR